MIEHLTAPPSDEPVTLDEAKTQLSVEFADDDAFITSLIKAAREHAEGHCNRGFGTQKWEAVLDAFPYRGHHLYREHYCFPPYSGFRFGLPCRACHLHIELPHGNLAVAALDPSPTVESIKYVDLDGALQTLAPTEYSVDAVSIPGRVHLAFGKSWPTARRQWDAVKIVYSVGWSVDAIPQSIKQAVLLLVSQMYEFRTPEVEKALFKVQFAYEALLQQHRIIAL